MENEINLNRQTTAAKRERITWIDMGKGICMLCVMLSHIDFVPELYIIFLMNFFIVGFFFFSGYTFHDIDRFDTFIYKKIRTLIIPIFIFGSIDIIMRIIITLSEPIPLSVQIKGMLFQIRGQYDELWFLAAMFTTSICFYLLVKFIKNEYIFVIVLLVLFVMSSLYHGPALPWHIHMIGSFSIWMGFGYLYKKHAPFLHGPYNLITIIGVILMYIIAVMLVNQFTIHGFWINLTNLVLSIMGTIFLIVVSQAVMQFRLIQFIGQNTIIYFAFHGKIESVLMKLATYFFAENILKSTTFLSYILSILFVVIEVAVLAIPAVIVNRYFPFFLGHKRREKKFSSAERQE